MAVTRRNVVKRRDTCVTLRHVKIMRTVERGPWKLSSTTDTLFPIRRTAVRQQKNRKGREELKRKSSRRTIDVGGAFGRGFTSGGGGDGPPGLVRLRKARTDCLGARRARNATSSCLVASLQDAGKEEEDDARLRAGERGVVRDFLQGSLLTRYMYAQVRQR